MSATSEGLNQEESRVCGEIARRESALYADLERLVAIPTGHGHAEGLDEARSSLCARLAQLGAEISLRPGDPRPEWLELPGHRRATAPPPTAIATRRAARGPRVLLAGHLDTVHDPAGDFRLLTREGPIARGPGAVDMKGGLVIAVHALESLAESGIDTQWTFLLNSDEESGSFHSLRHLKEAARQHDVGLALEPATEGGGLVVSRMGSGHFRIDCAGRAAHVGRDFERGVSATLALARVIVAVSELSAPDEGKIVNVGPLLGGDAANVVAAKASCWGNVRFRDAEAETELGRAVDALATPIGAMPATIVHRDFTRPAKPRTRAVDRLAQLVRGAADDLGQRMHFSTTGGVCDGNVLQAEGLPTLDTLGVRGGNLHRTDEFVEIVSLVERCQLLAVVMARLAQQAMPF